MTEVSKKAGEMWAKIDSDTKDRFEKKAKAAKEKYEEDYKVNLKTFLERGIYVIFGPLNGIFIFFFGISFFTE